MKTFGRFVSMVIFDFESKINLKNNISIFGIFFRPKK